MKRLVYTIESPQGFLQDVEQYTDDLLDAVTFTTFDVAIFRLNSVKERLKTECWVGVNYLDFPRLKPVPAVSGVYN